MLNYRNIFVFALVLKLAAISALSQTVASEPTLHDATVARFVAQLSSQDAAVRTAAAENLGFLRAYAAAEALTALLSDDLSACRRAAVTSLAWCGGKDEVDDILKTLNDSDWSVRQAAWVALTNITGQEFPFDSHETPTVRKAQVSTWEQWWKKAEQQKLPASLDLKGVATQTDLAANCPVTASSTYKGPVANSYRCRQRRFLADKECAVPSALHC